MGKLHKPKLMQLKSRERIWKKLRCMDWTKKVEIRTWKKFLAVGKAGIATFDLLQALNEKHVSSGLSTEGTLTSTST